MPFCNSRRATPLARHAASLQAEMQAEATIPFPMYTVPLEEALQMSCVEPHEKLKERGLLVKFEKNLGKAVFVSHQWAGKSHPDPTFEQFRVFQDSMKNILSDRLHQIPLDFVTETYVAKAKPLATQEFRSEKLFIWYDYFSCPQLEESQGPESQLAKAIASIHAYVTQCSFFFALCPFFEDLVTSRVLGPSSWGDRGWCRLERTMRELSDGSWILIKSAERLELVVASRAPSCPTGEGDFAVATDKVKLGPVLEAALRGKMRKALCEGDFVTYRIVRNLQSVYLRGLPAELEKDVVPGFVPGADDSVSIVEHFLYQNGFWSLHEVDSAGFMPLHYAALDGEPLLIKALLQQRADPTRTTRKTQPLLEIPAWVSALGLALLCRHHDAARLLIEGKAKVQEDGMLIPASHLAALSNNVEGIRLLFDSGCDPKKERNLLGFGAMINACDANSLGVLEELLSRGVNISQLLHTTASSRGGATQITRRLIELRANIDERYQFRWLTPFGSLVALQSLRYRCGRDTALTRGSYHLFGSTPLMLALLRGNYETATILLREGARLDLRNLRKFSAADLAQGAPELLQEILKGDSVYCRV